MTLTTSLLSFTLAAAILAMTPGLDTAFILRQLIAHGARPAWRAALGVVLGCLLWGVVVASGLGVLLATSPLAFTVLKWTGAAYLVWQGIKMLWAARQAPAALPKVAATTAQSPLMVGFLTNALNPKIGVFYVAFLPQFVAQGVAPGPYMFGLACIHVVLSLLWFGALILAARRLVPWLQRASVRRALDALTGVVFVGFGLKLVASR